MQRAVDCDRNTAINFVSLIDREGRSLVKCGPFQNCSEVERIVERITGQCRVVHPPSKTLSQPMVGSVSC